MTLLDLPQIAENQALAHITSNDADGAVEAAFCDCKLDHDASDGDFSISALLFQRNWFHKIIGTAVGATTITLPAVKRPFMMQNNTGQNITLSIGGGIGTALPDGESHLMYSDGAIIHRLSDATGGGAVASFSGALV